MSFTNLNGQINIQKVGAGEIQPNGGNVILSTTNFENTDATSRVLAGRFASIEAGKLTLGNANTNGNTIAGVIVRETTNSLEVNPDSSFDAATNIISYIRSGLITVDAADNTVPAAFTKLYAVDADGKASATAASNTATNAEFIEEIKSKVWLVRLV